MFDYGKGELATIDKNLEPKLAWAKERSTETQQLALDATRLLSCTEGRLDQYRNKGFFKRCWYGLTGKTGELHRANDRDLVEMQKVAWRYLNLLQERDLMLAHSIITVRNNLLTLAVAEAETRREIERMANRVYERFVQLEERMKNVEVASSIHGWLLTLDARDYDERFSPHFRLLAVVRDFVNLKDGDWNIQELRYLQKGVKEAGLPWKESVSISRFLDELVDEIEEGGFETYTGLVLLPTNGSFIPGTFVLENIAVPSYVSLFELVDKYSGSSETVNVLADQMNISPKDAVKRVMKSSVQKQGINLETEIPLRDLAVELLHCMGLVRALHEAASRTGERAVVEAAIPEEEEEAAADDGFPEAMAEFEETLGQFMELVPSALAIHMLSPVSAVVDEYIAIETDEDEEVGDFFERLVDGLDTDSILEAVNGTISEIGTGMEVLAASVDQACEGTGIGVPEWGTAWQKVIDDDGGWGDALAGLQAAGVELLENKPKGAMGSLLAGGAAGLAAGALLGPLGIAAAAAGGYLWGKQDDDKVTEALDAWNAAVKEFLETCDEWREKAEKNLVKLLRRLLKPAGKALATQEDAEVARTLTAVLDEGLDDATKYLADDEDDEDDED